MRYFLGIDVQRRRACPAALLRADGSMVDAVWSDEPQALRDSVEELLKADGGTWADCEVGIDAPREAMGAPRSHYWEGNAKRWRAARPSDAGRGRHCEVVVSAHRWARPQWTPVRGVTDIPEWMELGFEMFTAFSRAAAVHEVFPSASYRLLREARNPVHAQIDVRRAAPGPRDLTDAVVAAATLLNRERSGGLEVGGGDGYGTIVLPLQPSELIAEVLEYPGNSDGPAR